MTRKDVEHLGDSLEEAKPFPPKIVRCDLTFKELQEKIFELDKLMDG